MIFLPQHGKCPTKLIQTIGGVPVRDAMKKASGF